jgi:hypothetical protein
VYSIAGTSLYKTTLELKNIKKENHELRLSIYESSALSKINSFSVKNNLSPLSLEFAGPLPVAYMH